MINANVVSNVFNASDILRIAIKEAAYLNKACTVKRCMDVAERYKLEVSKESFQLYFEYCAQFATALNDYTAFLNKDFVSRFALVNQEAIKAAEDVRIREEECTKVIEDLNKVTRLRIGHEVSLDNLMLELNSTDEKCVALDAELSLKDKELHEAREAEKAAKAAYEARNAEKAEKGKGEEKKKEVASLKKAYTDAMSLTKGKKAEYEEVQKALDIEKSRLDSLKTSVEGTKKRIKESQEEEARFKKKVDLCRADINEAKKRLDNATKNLDAEQANLDSRADEEGKLAQKVIDSFMACALLMWDNRKGFLRFFFEADKAKSLRPSVNELAKTLAVIYEIDLLHYEKAGENLKVLRANVKITKDADKKPLLNQQAQKGFDKKLLDLFTGSCIYTFKQATSEVKAYRAVKAQEKETAERLAAEAAQGEGETA